MNAATSVAAEHSSLHLALAEVMTTLVKAPVRIEQLRRLAGGASHETWAFDACHDTTREALVLRRDFQDPLLPVELAQEYAVLGSLSQAGIPIARPLWCDDQCRHFDTPAMIVARIDGTDLRKTLAAGHFAGERSALAQSLLTLQASIHALGADQLPMLTARTPAEEIETWADYVTRQRTPRPLLSAALGWLRANAPPAVTPALVHGDFKANNLLVDRAGAITVIDWEMAHLGDPLEDLAWTMLWTTGDDIVGGLLAREDYLARYAATAGQAVDPDRLRFWDMFALFKLAAIFISGAPDTQLLPRIRPVCLQLRRALPWLETRLAQQLDHSLVSTSPT